MASLWLTSSVLYTRPSGFVGHVSEVAQFGKHKCGLTHLIPDVYGCHVLWILAVAVCRIGDVCCLPAPAHQPFSFNTLDLSASEEACNRNICASDTLKFGYKGIFKITTYFS